MKIQYSTNQIWPINPKAMTEKDCQKKEMLGLMMSFLKNLRKSLIKSSDQSRNHIIRPSIPRDFLFCHSFPLASLQTEREGLQWAIGGNHCCIHDKYLQCIDAICSNLFKSAFSSNEIISAPFYYLSSMHYVSDISQF